jgi:hypothetical protein
MENTTDIPYEDNHNNDEQFFFVVALICTLFFGSYIICSDNMVRRNCVIRTSCIIRKKPRINTQTIDHNIIIKNNMLTKTYIQKLNENNKSNNNYSDCSICIEKIKKKKDIIRLDCGHNFHINCMQDWIQVKLEAGIGPECPLCREKIIDLNLYRRDNNNWYGT